MHKQFEIVKQNYSSENLAYLNFENLQMVFNNKALDFERADFRGCNIKNCILKNNNLNRADFIDLIIKDCIFNGVNFGMSLFKNCYIEKTNFSLNTYNSTAIQECIFQECIIQEAHANWTLYNSTFISCTFVNTAFNHSAVDSNKFINCTFINCNLAECHMENIEFHSCCLKNVEFDISYLGSYLINDMDISIVKYKYRGKTLSLTSYPDNELTLLFENQRYFEYLNILILRNETTNLYVKVVNIFNNLLKVDQNNQNIRLYNIKNIFKMFEFYHTCHKLDCLEFQKILLFFNNIVWENISFREQLEYEACLYRINAINKFEEIPISNIINSDNNDKCLAKIHINSNNYENTINEFNVFCKTIGNDLLQCNNENLYEIVGVENGSIVLIIASSLLLTTLLVKVAVSISKSIFQIKMEKAVNDTEISFIKNAKNHDELMAIIKNSDSRSLICEKNYSKVMNKLSNSLLIGEIISIVISLII